jgi:ribosomal protein S12 methylthiotransferase
VPERRVAVLTLGCARNEVDSEELAARLAAGGYTLVAEAADADAVVVNTCGFVDAAKQESIDTLIAAADLKDDGRPRAVVAVGCLAERYGTELAAALPEADAVLGFDAYRDLAARVDDVLAGTSVPSHVPRDRRELLPVLEAAPPRVRLEAGVVAPLKLASGCDRRCSFCAIPRFRGAFVSRPPAEVVAEARWLAGEGVREIHLVSENTTSYGKDLGDVRALEHLVPAVAAVPGVARVRLAYLQPAEVRPGLFEVLTSTPGVADYLDLSFQHASGPVLRRMRRFGDTERFLALIARGRELAPDVGVRSNVIVGFPGETEEDVAELERFLSAARLDAVGVFSYSDEEGTEAVGLDGHVDEAEVRRRHERISSLVEVLMAERAQDRVGSTVEVLVERVDGDVAEGRAAHQGPEDGSCTLPAAGVAVGDLVPGRVVAADGVDLVVAP